MPESSEKFFKIKDNKTEISFPSFPLRICCNDRVNGEISLLQSIIKNSPDQGSHIFDIGATGSTFPCHSNTTSFHLFDPTFDKARADHPCKLYRGDVNYDSPNVTINKAAVNDTTNRLDDYCKARDISRIDFLKIDTDGHDMGVIDSIGDIDVELIQFEYDMHYFLNHVDINTFFSKLEGWHFFYILPQGLVEIGDFKHDFIYSNILASKKYPVDIIRDYKPIINADNVIETDDVRAFLSELCWEATPDQVTSLIDRNDEFCSQYNETIMKKNYYIQYIQLLHD